MPLINTAQSRFIRDTRAVPSYTDEYGAPDGTEEVIITEITDPVKAGRVPISALASVGLVTTTGGSVARAPGDHFGDQPHIKDFGGTLDGTTDDRTALVAAVTAATNKMVVVSGGTLHLATAYAPTKPVFLAGANFTGNSGATLVGDLAHGFKGSVSQLYTYGRRDSSRYTDTPTSYTALPTYSQHHRHFVNGVGYQQSVASDSGGRTLVAGDYFEGTHSGYADLVTYYATFGITKHATAASATAWTGRNSMTLFGGGVGANSDLVNIYGSEINLKDNGNKNVAGLSSVMRHQRTAVNDAAYTTPWIGYRVQNASSSVASDVAFQAVGTWNVGLDFSGNTFDADQGAIVLKQNQRMYLNADASVAGTNWFAGDGNSLGTTYFAYSSALSAMEFTVGGTSSLQVAPSFVRAVGYYVLGDGVTAPAATASQAKLYVDTADGDLKIIFGDGTIKTIVTDT